MEKNTAQSRVTSLAEVWIEIITIGRTFVPALVTSLAEVWIEISLQQLYTPSHTVTSLAEVWIEIFVKSAWGWEYESLPLRKCGLKYWAVLHMGIRGVSAIIINIIKTYWNPWICLIFIFTSWEIPMQPFCWRIVLIQKVFRICRTCQGNYIRRCLWRYTGNHRRLSGRTGTIYWRSYSKREERSVLWLFRNDWNRLNSGGIFQRSMMKNRIVVIEKSTNKNRTFVLFSCVNLYTFKNLFDIIGTVTRTNSKKYDRTGG